MSDILDRAEDLAERYNSSGFIHKEATLLLPELIAEIKRLRGQQKYLAMATPCSIDDQFSFHVFSARVTPTPKQINYSDGLKKIIARDEQKAAYVARLETEYVKSQAARLFYADHNTGAQWGQVGESYREPYEKAANTSLEKIKKGEQ